MWGLIIKGFKFQDMFAVGMFSPLFPKYGRQIGMSSTQIGLFGEY